MLRRPAPVFRRKSTESRKGNQHPTHTTELIYLPCAATAATAAAAAAVDMPGRGGHWGFIEENVIGEAQRRWWRQRVGGGETVHGVTGGS